MNDDAIRELVEDLRGTEWNMSTPQELADLIADRLDEALRQSQSLPAGAVAGLVGKWRINSEICSGTGAVERAVELSRCADQLEQALQADAREKGEDPVAWRIVGGSGELACFETESDKAAAWNGYYTAIPMYDHPATQPAQASEESK